MTYPVRFLPKGHELYWMEEVISNLLGVVSKEHDAEHAEMSKHWNVEYRNPHPITSRYVDGEWHPDRAWHLALHIKFWHETGRHPELVEKYKQLNGDPDDIDRPFIPGV